MNTYSDREINSLLESLSRIERQVKLINEGKTTIKNSGVPRLSVIKEKAMLCRIILTKQSQEALAENDMG